MSKITMVLRAVCLIALASVLGSVIGGVSSYVVVRVVVLLLGPIFWEGGDGFLPMFATVLGGVIGGTSAAVCSSPVVDRIFRRKMYAGLCVGVVPSLAYACWLVSHGSFTSPDAPKGIAFWIVVVLVIAGGLAGTLGCLVADADNWRFSIRSLLIFMTLIAILLGLIVLLP